MQDRLRFAGPPTDQKLIINGNAIDINDIMAKIWPRSYLMPDADQWHCSNCGGIFKQVREPAILYCPWCGYKFIRIDPECMLSKHMSIQEDDARKAPSEICQKIHKVESCEDCKSKDCQIYRNYKNCQDA